MYLVKFKNNLAASSTDLKLGRVMNLQIIID